MQYRRPSLLLLGLGLACSPVVETDPGFDAAYGSGSQTQGFATGGYASGTGGGFATGGAYLGTGGAFLATGGAFDATGGALAATGGAPGTTGGAPGATGGAVGATGGAVGNTGGTVDPGNCPTANAPFSITGGYVASGQWGGYAYTWTGVDGTPQDAMLPAEFTDDLCATGTLGASYDAVGGIGISVAQANAGTDPPKALWNTACASGISYNVTNTGGTELRVQVNVSDSVSYCAKISSTAGNLVWSEFNTKCWDGTGTALPAGTQIVSVNVTVPGTEAGVLSPDFCINSIGHY